MQNLTFTRKILLTYIFRDDRWKFETGLTTCQSKILTRAVLKFLLNIGISRWLITLIFRNQCLVMVINALGCLLGLKNPFFEHLITMKTCAPHANVLNDTCFVLDTLKLLCVVSFNRILAPGP
jgi:hypothetical protein